MNFKVKTCVKQDYKVVFRQFDETLFKALKPPFIGLNVKKFDGSQLNDEVHVELNFLGVKRLWISRITEYNVDKTSCYFTDTSSGKNLPAPLKEWKHQHLILKNKYGAEIIDNITFTSGYLILDFLLFPVLWLQFAYRKSIYRKYFK